MDNEKTINEIKTSAHKIWLAGLGAVAMAEEGGEKLFKSLVDHGEGLENRGMEQVDQLKEKVADATTKGKDALGKVGNTFDDAVGGALMRLGVPTRDEIATLTKRVEELTASVERLTDAKVAKAS